MDSDTRYFVLIPVLIGLVIGAIIGGWISNSQDFPILGVFIGGILGGIFALFIGAKLYGWALDDLEREWREASEDEDD